MSGAAHMARALALAAQALGSTAPNPAVGCVIARGETRLGEGATGPGGRPHAEERALSAAGADARDAEAFVTLEPCARRSSGAPACADLLIAAGVARVVVAAPDPHPAAAGAGLARMRAAGIEVIEGLMRPEALAQNAGFFHRVRTGRPLVFADADPSSYEGAFARTPGETLDAALLRFGAAGFSRLWVAPGSALAAELAAANALAIAPPPPRRAE